MSSHELGASVWHLSDPEGDLGTQFIKEREECMGETAGGPVHA